MKNRMSTMIIFVRPTNDNRRARICGMCALCLSGVLVRNFGRSQNMVPKRDTSNQDVHMKGYILRLT
eukprot:UN13045